MARGLSKKGVEGRIWDKISPEPNSGCWLWTGAVSRDGYGYIKMFGKNTGAHRAVYEHYVGKIELGLELDHICRVPCCVNPDHLEPVTHKENMHRSDNGPRTHCRRGHLFDAENTRIGKRGKTCKRCESERRQIPEIREQYREYMKAYNREYKRKRAAA